MDVWNQHKQTHNPALIAPLPTSWTCFTTQATDVIQQQQQHISRLWNVQPGCPSQAFLLLNVSSTLESFSNINRNSSSCLIFCNTFFFKLPIFSNIWAISRSTNVPLAQYLSSPTTATKVLWCLMDQSDALCFFSFLYSQNYEKPIFSAHTQNRYLANIQKFVC